MEQQNQQQHIPQPPAEDEIDLVEIIRFLWDSRKTILIVIGIFVVIGLFVALFSTPQYKVEARILPEIQQQRGGASDLLRQIGGISGFNVGSEASEALRPDLYPRIVQSTPFFMHLLEQEIEVSEVDEDVTVQKYLEEHIPFSLAGAAKRYTIGLPRTILGGVRSLFSSPGEEASPLPQRKERISRLTREQHQIIEGLRARIDADMDMQSWVISVSAEFPDPVATAHITELAVDYLSQYITEYRTEKAQGDLNFVKERYEEKKQEFYEAQEELARFRDANKNIVSALVETEEQRLQDEYNLAYNVYNNLAQRLEEIRMRVQEETPVIKLLEPVQVPVERSKPKRTQLMMIYTFLGVVLGVGFVFGRREYYKLRGKLRE